MTKTLKVQSIEIPFQVLVRKRKENILAKKTSELGYQNEPLPQSISFVYETLWSNVNTMFKCYEFIFSTPHGVKS